MYAAQVPTVQFKAIVFLNSEEEINKFANILQDLATKVLATFSIINNTQISYKEKQDCILSLKDLAPDLITLVEIDKKIATSNGLDDEDKKLLREKQQEIVQCQQLLQNLFQNTPNPNPTDSITNRNQEIQHYQQILQALLDLLRFEADLLQLQNQQKVNDILRYAQFALMAIKQVRDYKPLPSSASNSITINRLRQEFQQALEDMIVVIDSRIPVIEDEQDKQQLMESSSILKDSLPKILAAIQLEQENNNSNNNSETRTSLIQTVVPAISSVVAVAKKPLEFSSCFVTPNQEEDFDFMNATTMVMKAIQGLSACK